MIPISANLIVAIPGEAGAGVPVTARVNVGPPGRGVQDGGTTGQVLAKASADDYDTGWVSPGAASEITGLVEAGTNVTLSGAGTSASPYVISASGGGGSGTVTSVGMTVPTGLEVSGSPITASGTLAVSLASGYVIPTQTALDGKVSTSTTVNGQFLTGNVTIENITGNAGTVTNIGNLTGVVTSTNRETAIANNALSIAMTNGLQSALDGKSPLAGSSSVATVGTITSGTWQANIIAPAYLGTGTSITTKFLRGDGTWQTISGGGDALTSSNLGQFADVTQTSGQTLSITSSTTLAGGSHSGTNTGDKLFTVTTSTVTGINGATYIIDPSRGAKTTIEVDTADGFVCTVINLSDYPVDIYNGEGGDVSTTSGVCLAGETAIVQLSYDEASVVSSYKMPLRAAGNGRIENIATTTRTDGKPDIIAPITKSADFTISEAERDAPILLTKTGTGQIITLPNTGISVGWTQTYCRATSQAITFEGAGTLLGSDIASVAENKWFGLVCTATGTYRFI